MAFDRPSLTSLIDQTRDDVDGRLPGADSRLRRSSLDVLARVLGGGMHGLYGYLDYIAAQISPETADSEHLRRHAKRWGIVPKAATPATGIAVATGEDDSTIPAGALLQRADGAEFIVQTAAVVGSGTANVAIAAVAAGAAGLADAGTRLTLVSPIAGVASVLTVAAPGLAGGADQEKDPELLSRLLARIQQTPQGGAKADYIDWTLEVAGVTRAWVFPNWNGAGSVGVTFMCDSREDPVPTSGDLAAVEAHLEDLRPVTAALTVFAPGQMAVPLTIQMSPNTAANRAAVEAELVDFFRREASPGGPVFKSRLDEAISSAAGERDHLLTVPSANIYPPPGVLPVLGEITWAG
jgi:uncharacterized phage protein gp47/JayE